MGNLAARNEERVNKMGLGDIYPTEEQMYVDAILAAIRAKKSELENAGYYALNMTVFVPYNIYHLLSRVLDQRPGRYVVEGLNDLSLYGMSLFLRDLYNPYPNAVAQISVNSHWDSPVLYDVLLLPSRN